MSLGEATAMGLALALGEDKAVRNHFAARGGPANLPSRLVRPFRSPLIAPLTAIDPAHVKPPIRHSFRR